MKKPSDVAKASKQEYMTLFGELYEHSPWVIETAYEAMTSSETYNDLENFHTLLATTVLEASLDLQMSLIQAHPMLAGKKAKNNELTDFSTNEQKSAGLDSCSDEEIATFDDLNQKYFAKFNFPYILAVKGRNKDEILVDFKERLTHTLEVERVMALAQINHIAWIRIKGIYER
jgi:2-oxo-4-hydroxy-4-carboxy-5-ureidoimidazoline decarboxylase